MKKTKKKNESAIAPVMVTCDACKSSVHGVATRITKDGRRCIDCLTWSLRPVWKEAKVEEKKYKTPICSGCFVEDGTVERVADEYRAGMWLCSVCRALYKKRAIMPPVTDKEPANWEPIYDPASDAPLHLEDGIAEELQQILNEGFKFNDDVVSKTDHDKIVDELQSVIGNYKRLVAKLVIGHLRADATYGDACTLSYQSWIDDIPDSAITIGESIQASIRPTTRVRYVTADIDPAVDPRRKTSPEEEARKLADAFNSTFFGLKKATEPYRKEIANSFVEAAIKAYGLDTNGKTTPSL